METSFLEQVLRAWISLFAHSPRSRITVKTQTGQSSKTQSPTRWWLRFEVIKQVYDLFGDKSNFLDRDDLPEVTKRKVIDICDHPE